MNSCKVLFYATLKDRAGVRQSVLDLPDGSTVSDFKAVLEKQFPSIRPILPNALIAVNREYALDDAILPAGAEIAVFPPVSGGTTLSIR